MKRKAFWVLAIALLGGLLILQWSPKGSGPWRPALAQGDVEECRPYLVDQDLVRANGCFRDAVDLDPADPEANLFYAVTRILALAYDTSLHDLLDNFGVGSEGRDLYDWTADFDRDAEGEVVLPSGAPGSDEVMAWLTAAVLPEIDGALENLSRIDESSFDPIYLEANETPAGVRLEVDYCDVVLFKAVLHAAKAAIAIVDAYDLSVSDIGELLTKISNDTFSLNEDILGAYENLLTLKPFTSVSGDDGDFDGGDLAAFAAAFGCSSGQMCYDAAMDFDGSGLIDEGDLGAFAREYGWETPLAKAKSHLATAIALYLEASACIRSETDPQEDDLFFIAPEDLADEEEFRNILEDVQCALGGPCWIGQEFEDSVMVDLTRFFDDPIDIRDYLPTFDEDNEIVAYNFPDPTMNGIVPDFTQDTWANLLELTIPVSGQIQCPGFTSGNIVVQGLSCPWWAADGFHWCSSEARTTLSSTGAYTLCLPAGNEAWIRAFWDKDNDGRPTPGDVAGVYPANPVNVISENGSGPDDIDVVLDEEIIGISGRITSGGVGVAGASIDVCADKCWYGSWLGYANTDENGFYVINGLPEVPVYLEVYVWSNQYIGGWWDGSGGVTSDCGASAGVTPSAGATTVNIALEPADSISGHVRDESGNPIAWVSLRVEDYNTGDWLGSNSTQLDGSYTVYLNRTHSGSCRIQARIWDGNFISQYYDNKLHRDDADPIDMSDVHHVAGIDFELKQGGRIMGRVTDTTGNPIQWSYVEVYDFNTGNYIKGTSADEDGWYTVNGLPGDTYIVHIYETSQYCGGFYNGKSSWDEADPVSVIAGTDTDNIDFVLCIKPQPEPEPEP